MTAAAWALGSVMAYVLAARGIFRYTIRRGHWRVEDYECSHGYQQLHRGHDCHGSSMLDVFPRAFISLGLAILFPLMLILLVVIHNPPQSHSQLEAHIRDLERELNL